MSDNGFTGIRNDIIRSGELTPYEKAVLCVLLSYGNCGDIYLSQGKIAEQANMSRREVSRAVKSLTKKKYIRTTIQPDRSSLLYELLTKAVTTDSHRVTPVSLRGYATQSQEVTPVSHTSNKIMSNKNEEKETKKEKLVALAVRCISLFNEISTSKCDVNNPSHQKGCIAIIKQLHSSGVKEDDAVLAKFRYVFENQKKIHDDPNHYWNHYKLSTLLRLTNFFNYVDESPYRVKQEVSQHQPAAYKPL